MKIIALLLAFSLTSSLAYGQAAKDILISIQSDLIRSDHDGYFEKVQTAAEGNYFFTPKISATGGLEYWTNENQFSVVIGARWYPIDYAFVRLRGLLGANDISVGGGWTKPLGGNFKFEAMADVYAEGYVSIRAGFSYLIVR